MEEECTPQLPLWRQERAAQVAAAAAAEIGRAERAAIAVAATGGAPPRDDDIAVERQGRRDAQPALIIGRQGLTTIP